jgi:hypothetical protein
MTAINRTHGTKVWIVRHRNIQGDSGLSENMGKEAVQTLPGPGPVIAVAGGVGGAPPRRFFLPNLPSSSTPLSTASSGVSLFQVSASRRRPPHLSAKSKAQRYPPPTPQFPRSDCIRLPSKHHSVLKGIVESIIKSRVAPP